MGRGGWAKAATPRLAIEDKERKLKEEPDLQVRGKKYKMDLVPPSLLVARFFPSEHDVIEKTEFRREMAERELQEFVEENIGEEGLLEEATNEKGKLTAKVDAHLKRMGLVWS